MSDTSQANTKRGYLSQDELSLYADITITDEDEMNERISHAEEIIDAWAGFQTRAICEKLDGRATSGTTNTITLQEKHQNIYEKDYFLYTIIEIIGGTGVGQQRRCIGSTKAGVLTTLDVWGTVPDSTSVYRIYQLGKFPTKDQEFYDTDTETPQYYRYILENVRRAVAAQVEYMIEMGDEYFSSNNADKVSESIGDYSYSLGSKGNPSGLDKIVSPKAKAYMRGVRCIVGEL